MNSKNFLKSTGSALILGSSLASLVGQQSVNANLLGSIKNFLFSSKTENEEKKLSLNERKERHNQENALLPPGSSTNEVMGNVFIVGAFFSVINAVAYYVGESSSLYHNFDAFKRLFGKGLFFSALFSIGVGFYHYIMKRSVEKDLTELKKSIGEYMLENQWKFKDFKEMAEKNDGESKRFLEQLLVLEPSSSENNKEDAPLLDKNKLNKKVEAFKDLFTKEPEELKSVKETDKKRIYKELINSLFYWCSGRMERLYDPGKKTEYEKNYFIAQDDIELASRIILLRKIVLGEKVDYQLKITNLTVKDFNENIKDENMENFRKLLVFDIRNYISEQDANDETIINILTELTEPNEVGQPIDYYKKIKTFFEEEFKDKQKQNRVLLGLKNFFKEERLYNRGFKYVFKEAYESFKRVER